MEIHEIHVDPDPTDQVMERLLRMPNEAIVVARYRHSERNGHREASDVLVRTGIGGWTHTSRHLPAVERDRAKTYWDESAVRNWVKRLYLDNETVKFFVVEMEEEV